MTRTSFALELVHLYLLGVKMNLSHTHKTRFGYLLGALFKISDDHPRHFYMKVPLPRGLMITNRALYTSVFFDLHIIINLFIGKWIDQIN